MALMLLSLHAPHDLIPLDNSAKGPSPPPRGSEESNTSVHSFRDDGRLCAVFRMKDICKRSNEDSRESTRLGASVVV